MALAECRHDRSVDVEPYGAVPPCRTARLHTGGWGPRRSASGHAARASWSCPAERPQDRPPLRSGMTHQRSHANIVLGQQIYPVLEQCRKPEVLWAKLATGNYDWLGVRRNGKYVLGRPRLSTVIPQDPGATAGRRPGTPPHRVPGAAGARAALGGLRHGR